MFSKPLANSSTLDRRLAVAQLRGASSYVEELWSPALVVRRENRRLKQQIFIRVFFLRAAQRAFLSQAGPHVRSDLSQAEHHLVYEWVGVKTTAVQTTKAARLGRPRFKPLCA